MTSRHGRHFKIREFSYSLRFARYLFDYTRVVYPYFYSISTRKEGASRVLKMPVEDQRKRCKMLLVEWNSVCNFASKPGMFFILSLDLCYLQIFATITKNIALIFTPYSWDLTCFYCCARSVKKVHGGILIWVMLFITAAIFTSVIDVFLGIEMADAGTHRIEIANLCRFCGRTASSKDGCKT